MTQQEANTVNSAKVGFNNNIYTTGAATLKNQFSVFISDPYTAVLYELLKQTNKPKTTYLGMYLRHRAKTDTFFLNTFHMSEKTEGVNRLLGCCHKHALRDVTKG